MRFIVDAQLPPALALWLVEAGHEALHVEEIGLLDAEDPSIWRYAFENKAVILSKDEDFPVRVRQSQSGLWLSGCGSETAPIALCGNGLRRCCPPFSKKLNTEIESSKCARIPARRGGRGAVI